MSSSSARNNAFYARMQDILNHAYDRELESLMVGLLGLNSNGNMQALESSLEGDLFTALRDGSGNLLTTTVDGLARGLDVYLLNPEDIASATVSVVSQGSRDSTSEAWLVEILQDSTTDPLLVSVLNSDDIGGGTQYDAGDTPSPVRGTALMWDEGGTIRAASAAKPLPVDIGAVGTLDVRIVQDSTADPVLMLPVGGEISEVGNVTSVDTVDTLTSIANTVDVRIVNDSTADPVLVDLIDKSLDVTVQNSILDVRIVQDSTADPVLIDPIGPVIVNQGSGSWGIDSLPDVTVGTWSAGTLDVRVVQDSTADPVLIDPIGPVTVNQGAENWDIDSLPDITVGTWNAGTLDVRVVQDSTADPVLVSLIQESLDVRVVQDSTADPVIVQVSNTDAIGGGTQYDEGDVVDPISGTAVLWEDTGNTLRVPSATYPLPVDIVAAGTLDVRVVQDSSADPVLVGFAETPHATANSPGPGPPWSWLAEIAAVGGGYTAAGGFTWTSFAAGNLESGGAPYATSGIYGPFSFAGLYGSNLSAQFQNIRCSGLDDLLIDASASYGALHAKSFHYGHSPLSDDWEAITSERADADNAGNNAFDSTAVPGVDTGQHTSRIIKHWVVDVSDLNQNDYDNTTSHYVDGIEIPRAGWIMFYYSPEHASGTAPNGAIKIEIQHSTTSGGTYYSRIDGPLARWEHPSGELSTASYPLCRPVRVHAAGFLKILISSSSSNGQDYEITGALLEVSCS